MMGWILGQTARAQPPDATVPPQPRPEPSRSAPLAAETSGPPTLLRTSPFAFLLADAGAATSGSTRRLASTPPMFGDVFPQQSVAFFSGDGLVTADMPLAGASRRVKVAEQNLAMPVDRVFFHYHHFHNALNLERSLGPGGPVTSFSSSPVDRYTVGFEKTFCCGLWSVEVRLPLTGEETISTWDLELAGGHVGNLAVILKRLVCENELGAVAAGLAIDAPTGSDVTGCLPPADVTFSVHNDAVHLSPYVGILSAPSEFYYHGFVQLDVPLGGNRVEVEDFSAAVKDMGSLNEQVLLYVDVGAGCWLLRRPCAEVCTGVAMTAELHYTTTFQNADTVPQLGGVPQFGNAANRMDVVNLTVGLHCELADQAQLRVGGVCPLASDDDRFFDSELVASAIWRF